MMVSLFLLLNDTSLDHRYRGHPAREIDLGRMLARELGLLLHRCRIDVPAVRSQ
jgi:hypothetical protein